MARKEGMQSVQDPSRCKYGEADLLIHTRATNTKKVLTVSKE